MRADLERITMTRLLCGASLLALSTIPVLAPASARAQDVLDLEMITVYANQSELPIDRTGTSVEVVAEEQLETAPQTRLADYLGTLPGVSVTSNGGIGATSTVRVRGLSGAYVPVLINGIDVTDPSGTQTSFDWSNLVMGDIARVEVVKGSQSALYGSEAIGGLIAITTARAPKEPGTTATLRAEVGSNNTRRAGLSVGTATERSGLAFSLSRTVTDGFSTIEAPGYSEKDGYDGTQLTFDGYVDLTDTLRVGVTAYALNAEADYDAGAFATQPESGLAETETRAVRAYADLSAGGIDHSFGVTRYRITRESTSDGNTDTFEGDRDSVAYKGTTTLGTATLSFGADWTREDAKAAEHNTVSGIFAEVLFAPRDDLDLSVSLRHDSHSEFGGQTSARAALAWRPVTDLTFRAVLSNGFRAPSLYELYEPTYGNAGLDPETSRNAELGIEKVFGNESSVKATLFYTEIDDLIDYFDPDGFLGPIDGAYAQVDGTTSTQGLELAGRLPVSDRITLTGAFTYTDSRDPDDDPRLRVPRYDLSVGVDARVTDRLRTALNVQRIADVPDDFGLTAVDPVKDYALVNASVSYVINDSTSAYLRIENLTDADYQVVPDYQSADRAAYFGVVASF
jgi:vitamin B12 transporter